LGVVVVTPVEAQSPIAVAINADGSITPLSAPMQRDGNTYTLTGDVGQIAVCGSNLILDGNNHTLPGEVVTFNDALERNITTHNTGGIFLRDVKNVTIKNFIITGCQTGIFLDWSSNITVSGNTITGTFVRFPDMQATAAIEIWGTNFSSITNNHLENNIYGICMGEYSEGNSVFGNNITGSGRQGLRFYVSSDNCIYHNNFSNNTVDVYDCGPDFDETISVNMWDNGEEGNFWSNYNGTDTNEDGIGDVPYVVDANNTDYYPLMVPYGTNHVSVLPTEKTSPTPTPHFSSPLHETQTPSPTATQQPAASPSASALPQPAFTWEAGLALAVVVWVGAVAAAGLLVRKRRRERA
jgi:parallel beta-helix repeat protein